MENPSPDWEKIKAAYCDFNISGRQLAKEHGITEGAVRKRAKKEKWVRLSDIPVRIAPQCVPDDEPVNRTSVGAQDEFAGASPTDLTKRGRNLILDLMAELEFLNRNHRTLTEMVETYVSGEKDDGARAKLLRSLDHETRAKTANNLATALAKLNDAGPGKKRQAEDDAKTAGANSEWNDDLEFAGARPN